MRILKTIREFEPMTRMVAATDLSASDYYTDGYAGEVFPRGGHVPNSIVVEIIAQAASLFLGASHDFRIKAVPIVLNSVEFHHLLHPGARLTVEVQLVSLADPTAYMRAVGRSEGAAVVEADFIMGFGNEDGTWALPTHQELQRIYFESIFERAGRSESPAPVRRGSSTER